MTVFPAMPSFRSIRLAIPGDIMRLGVVSAAGFRYSPVFTWERPHHAQFPQDTLDSYRSMYISAMQDPRCVVVVATDAYELDEAKKTEAIIPPDPSIELPKQGDEIVVGVAYWKLEPESKRIGQFNNNKGPYPEIPENQHRDEDPIRCEAAGKVWSAADKKYLDGYSSMNIVVVHPAYWRRGHGSNLVSWGMRLTDMDATTQGVISAGMGDKLYMKLGFEKICETHIEGDDQMPEGVTNGILRYGAMARGSHL